MVEGFVLEYNKREGLFCKRLKSGRALKQIEERGGGFGQNCHSSSSSRCQEQRRGRGALAALGPTTLGAGGGREGGGKEEGRPGNRFPSSISEEGARREGATAMAVMPRRRPWRWHSEVRWRPGLGERARGGRGVPIPALTSGVEATRRRRDYGRRRPASACVAAALWRRGEGVRWLGGL